MCKASNFEYLVKSAFFNHKLKRKETNRKCCEVTKYTTFCQNQNQLLSIKLKIDDIGSIPIYGQRGYGIMTNSVIDNSLHQKKHVSINLGRF